MRPMRRNAAAAGILMAALAACDIQMSPPARHLTPQEVKTFYDGVGKGAVHFRDPRTGLCYAHFPRLSATPTQVECTEEVLRLIANPEASETSASDAGTP